MPQMLHGKQISAERMCIHPHPAHVYSIGLKHTCGLPPAMMKVSVTCGPQSPVYCAPFTSLRLSDVSVANTNYPPPPPYPPPLTCAHSPRLLLIASSPLNTFASLPIM